MLRSPAHAKTHLEAILPLALKFVSYDPNYADDMDEVEGADEDAEDEDE